MRDDFSKLTIEKLALRSGYLCSKPDCKKPTRGAASDDDGTINIGVAAHITAAAPGGPRYDPSLTSGQRKHHTNGIWLCQTHSKLIDSDEQHFTVKMLQTWKQLAEQNSFEALLTSKAARDKDEEIKSFDMVDPSLISQLGLPEEDDVPSVIARLKTAAEYDLLAFKRIPGWPHHPIALNLKLVDDKASVSFYVSELATAIETFNEITVIAPPGTGKTTTLLQFANIILEEGTSVATFISLSEWSTRSDSFFQCFMRRLSFRNNSEEHFKLLAHHGRLVLILDGWNELDIQSKKLARTEIKCIQRDFPNIRFIISTRQQKFDIPISGPVVKIGALTEEQQLEIAKTLRGQEGETLIDHAWRTPGIRELIAIPLYLTALLAQTLGGTLPTTKEEVLRMFVAKHEHDVDKAEALREQLFGFHSEMLTAIAVEATVAANTTIPDDRARAVVKKAADNLKAADQITSFPQPTKVLDSLVSLHMLVRSGEESGGLSFQHQQFQEWYASFKVEELMFAAASGDSEALKRFRTDMLNITIWEESILFACERLSFSNHEDSQALSGAILETMTIDPILSAEMIFRSSENIWEQTKKQIISFVEKWHKDGKIDRAVQFMINTGCREFGSYIWPLISNENSQIHLEALRAGCQFRPGVLGPDVKEAISVLSERLREHVLSEIAIESGMDGIELSTKLAQMDESPNVQVAVINALQFRRADRFVTEILRTAPKEVWPLLAKEGNIDEYADPMVAARLLKEKVKIFEVETDPFQKMNMLLYSGIQNSEIGKKIGAMVEGIDFSESIKGNEWAIHRAHEFYPDDICAALINQLKLGRVIPFRTEDLLKDAGITVDDGPIVEIVLQPENKDIIATIAAKIVGPKTVGKLIDQILTISFKTKALEGSYDKAISDEYYRLSTMISTTSLNPFVQALLERSQIKEPNNIALLVDLFAHHNKDRNQKPLILESKVKEQVMLVFQHWAEILLASSTATRPQLADMACAIGQLASPQLVPVLQLLLVEDLKRWKSAIEKVTVDRQKGKIRQLPTCWTQQYSNAFSAIGDVQVVEVMKTYLSDANFRYDAACVLRSIWKEEQPAKKKQFLIGHLDFSVAKEQQKKHRTDGANVETCPFVDIILAAVKPLLKPDAGIEERRQALKLSTVAFSMPYGNKADIINTLLRLPVPAIEKQDLLRTLVLAGETIGATIILSGINDLLKEAKTKQWLLDEQDGWGLNRWLSLLPFSDKPIAVIDVLESLEPRHKSPWKLRGLLSALGYAPSVDSEKVLNQLAQRDKKFLKEYDWLEALTKRETLSGARLFFQYICSGALIDNKKHMSVHDLGSKLANAIFKFSELRTEVYQHYSALPAGTIKSVIEYAISEAADSDGVLYIVRAAAASGKLFAQTSLYSALYHILVGKRPSISWSGSQELFSLPAPELRRNLFKMTIHGDKAEIALAVECLNTIDEIRDDYGIVDSEPRHPDIESGFPWPRIEM